jgi:hypothetical protein
LEGLGVGSDLAASCGSASTFSDLESFLSEIFVFLLGSSGPGAAATASEVRSVLMNFQVGCRTTYSCAFCHP